MYSFYEDFYKILYKNGYQFTYAQFHSEQRGADSGFFTLANYLTSKMAWDSSLTMNDLIDDYFAAMYLDAGMETAAGFIHRCLLDDVRTIETPSFTDYKTALQELVQRQSGQVLSYELVGEEGPDHAKTFRMQVCLNGEPVGLGTGRTKKEAEQTAAASALEALRK